MDPFASIIALLGPRTVLSKTVSGSGQWGVRYPAYADPAFCLMLAGSCWLSIEGAAPLRLDEGDFLLMPTTPAFTLASNLNVPAASVTTFQSTGGTQDVRHGDADGEPAVRMLGGFFKFDPVNAPLLLDLLPAAVHIRRLDAGAERVRRIAHWIAEESEANAPGREPILERLAEVLLIEALRQRPVEQEDRPGGLLAGIADRYLAVALRCMHENVAHPWKIADLAREAGLSRASFAERFARTVGVPPMQYLHQWRMTLAKNLLRQQAGQLERVAIAIGYQSASAFSTAFSRHFGVAPSTFARGFAA